MEEDRQAVRRRGQLAVQEGIRVDTVRLMTGIASGTMGHDAAERVCICIRGNRGSY
jgi:hypothetical protein